MYAALPRFLQLLAVGRAGLRGSRFGRAAEKK